MRLLLLLLLSLPTVLCADTGPGSGVPLPHSNGIVLQNLIDQAMAYDHDDALLEGPATAAEKAAIATAFAPPAAISDRGDDLRKVAALSDSARAEIAKMRGVLDMVRSEARQIKNLTEAALESLPLGIHKRVGNIDIHLAIAEARFTATSAKVDIYLGLDLPDTNQDPIFIARNVAWSRTGGLAAEEGIDLELVADWGIDFNSGGSRLIIKKTDGGRDGTFVTVDCEGFVAGRLEATVLLSRDWVIPVENRLVIDNASLGTDSLRLTVEDRVHADFAIDITDGEGFLAEINLEQAFVFANKKEVQITVGAIAIDLSDAANPSEMLFPENYHSPHVMDGFAATTWQGFYLRGLEVRLPDQYAKQSGDTLTIGAPYLIIDRSGFTGHFYADGVLSLGDKSADGWAFSVDTFDLKITQNTFESAKLSGLINVPLLAGAADACYVTLDKNTPVGNIRREDCLGYSAYIGQNSFDFSVRTSDNYCVNLWKADLVIKPNSSIDLSYSNGQFDASATLNGTLTINAEVSPSVGFSMDSLSFDNLTLSNRAPHFSPGVWGFPDSITARLKSFELSFTHIGLKVDSLSTDDLSNAALSFNARLNVEGDMKLNCEGMFKLTGYLKENEGKQQWRFEKLRLKAFRIDASTDSWGIKAVIAFYEHDDDWGTGFYGAGTLRVSALGGSEIAAVAQFGTFPNAQQVEEKYFFVDVMAKFGNGITLPGGIQLMGIGGGVYKNMTRAEPIGQSFANPNDTKITLARDKVDAAAALESPFDGFLGESTSGTKYVVDLENGFGVFLQVIIAGENEEAFSVNARLELEVRDDGGWRAALDGNVTIMGPVNFDNDPKKTEGIGIFVHMSYVKSETYSGFKATADVFVNIQDNTIAGGLADSTGVASEPIPSDTARQKRLEFVAPTLGYAGNIALEFSTDQWYIHIGYPKFPGQPVDKRIALSMQILGAGVGTASYFCVGQNVPPIPPLPARVRSVVGEMDMSRDFAQYESAAGFAFGTELSLVANGKFGIFYFDMEAGLGFDINVRNYGNAICAGSGPNPDPIGVKGWYAAGQAYAYIDADVGIQTPWWLGNIRVSILKAGVAAVLQVKAPNPVWAKGVIAGYYSVCGGVLKGRFRVESEFGDNCVITGSDGDDPFASIDVISSISPDSSAVDVPVGSLVNAYMILPLDTISELGDREYIAQLVSQELKVKATGDLVDGQEEAIRGRFSFRFIPEDYLAPETEYLYTAIVRVRGRNKGAISWEPTEIKRETRAYPFTTGSDRTTLDEGNIAYSYPVAGMANFYRREYSEGYLKVNRKQSNLTSSITAVYDSGNGFARTAEATWNDDDNMYEWVHPSGLRSNKVYRFALIQNYNPAAASNGGDNGNNPGTNPGNTPGGIDQLPGNGGFGNGLPDGGPNAYWRFDSPVTMEVLTDDAVENLEIYSFHFRSSRYSTFQAKLNATFETTQLTAGQPIRVNFDNSEAFDTIEIQGTYTIDPLVRMKVTTGENFTAKGSKSLLFNNLTFFCPMDFPNREIWRNITAPIPYGAVRMTAKLSPIKETDLGNTVSGWDGGGAFLLDFPSAAKDIATRISTLADDSFNEILSGLVDAYINEGGGGSYEIDPGPFVPCFPSIDDVLRDVTQDDANQLEDFFFVEQLKEDLLEPLSFDCRIPEELIEIYSVNLDPEILDFNDTRYPVRFNYVLPGERVQPDIILTFNY